MELRHFRYFTVIAELLSFSKASQILRVAQPALSRQIKDFETELGFNVFERQNRSIILTNSGIKLLSDWKRISSELKDSISQCRMLASDVESKIHLGFLGSPSYFFLSEFIKEFHRRNAKFKLLISEGNQNDLLKQLQDGSIDLALNRPMTKDSGIIQKTFYSDKLYFVSEKKDGNDHPQCVYILSEIADLYLHRLSLKVLAAFPRQVQVNQIDNIQVALAMVKAGLGTAVLPGSVALSANSALVWTSIKGIEISLEVHYLKRNEKKLSNILALLHEEGILQSKKLKAYSTNCKISD